MRFPLPIFKAKSTLPERNGYNTLLLAAVDPKAEHPVAVAAQEIVESRYKLARLALALLGSIAIAAGVYMSMVPMVFMLGAVVPPVALLAWLRSGPGNRALELWGHEVEVQAAVALYGVSESTKRQREAAGMIAYSGYSFSDWTASEVVEGMKEHTKAARKWVESHEADLAHAEAALAPVTG